MKGSPAHRSSYSISMLSWVIFLAVGRFGGGGGSGSNGLSGRVGGAATGRPMTGARIGQAGSLSVLTVRLTERVTPSLPLTSTRNW